jgi:hypothetical protein
VRLGYDEAGAAKDIEMMDEHEVPYNEVLPEAVDHDELRALGGCVTKVKNQGQCGSCWAFSATGALEGQLAGCTSLSEQDLVACDTGSHGCNGGQMAQAFNFVKSNGIASEAAYPYTKSSTCDETKEKKPVATCTGSKSASGIAGLKSAVAQHPVSIAVTGGYLQHYKSGLIDDSGCSGALNHGVLAVGYGSTNGGYFRVKNSWGANWGESGYFRVAAKSGMCGLGKQSVYPTGVKKESSVEDAVESIYTSGDSCSLYEISSDTCGQSDLDCAYVKEAKKVEKGLKDGTCAAQGYTVKGSTTTKHYPVVGDITVTEYTKPSVWRRP